MTRRRSGSQPPWFDKRNYDHLNPARSPDPFGVWKGALDQRYGKWLQLNKVKGSDPASPAIQSKPGDIIRADPKRMPSYLVIPWGELSAPPGLVPSMMFGAQRHRWGDHMATRGQAGFAMWFNMDAPDETLREGFEQVLKAARGRYQSTIRQRGRRNASPRIVEAILGVWWSRRIIPIFDLDWHFAAEEPDARPTDVLLGRWVYGDKVDQPAKKVHEARQVLRQAMEQRPALHHHTKSENASSAPSHASINDPDELAAIRTIFDEFKTTLETLEGDPDV